MVSVGGHVEAYNADSAVYLAAFADDFWSNILTELTEIAEVTAQIAEQTLTEAA